jgi:hypothetical protein
MADAKLKAKLDGAIAEWKTLLRMTATTQKVFCGKLRIARVIFVFFGVAIEQDLH